MTAPGPTEEPLDPRRLAAMLRNERSVLRPTERTTAASIIDAFAELPDPTRRLAHAAATVRARLGEGWEIVSYVAQPFGLSITGTSDDGDLVAFRLSDDGVYWRTHLSLFTHNDPVESLDAAITAALTALEPTP